MEGDCVSPCRSANATDGSEPQQVVDRLETGRIEDEAGDVTEEAKSSHMRMKRMAAKDRGGETLDATSSVLFAARYLGAQTNCVMRLMGLS